MEQHQSVDNVNNDDNVYFANAMPNLGTENWDILGSNHHSDTAAPICDASINIEDGNATGNTDTNVPLSHKSQLMSHRQHSHHFGNDVHFGLAILLF
jgi:hypothetical protein